MARTQETTPRTSQETGPLAPGPSSASLLDDWDRLFVGEEAAPAIEPPAAEEPSAPSATRYLGFRVGPQLYAVPLAELSEVIRDTEITLVPRLRPYVRGIVSVRGTIVPIVDLRRRLAQGADGGGAARPVAEAGEPGSGGVTGAAPGPAEAVSRGARSSAALRRILITSFGGEFFGLLVDEVTHPFALEPSEVEPPPVTLPRRLSDLVQGIGLVEGRIHILLDLSAVLRFDAVLPLRGRSEGSYD